MPCPRRHGRDPRRLPPAPRAPPPPPPSHSLPPAPLPSLHAPLLALIEGEGRVGGCGCEWGGSTWVGGGRLGSGGWDGRPGLERGGVLGGGAGKGLTGQGRRLGSAGTGLTLDLWRQQQQRTIAACARVAASPAARKLRKFLFSGYCFFLYFQQFWEILRPSVVSKLPCSMPG